MKVWGTVDHGKGGVATFSHSVASDVRKGDAVVAGAPLAKATSGADEVFGIVVHKRGSRADVVIATPGVVFSVPKRSLSGTNIQGRVKRDATVSTSGAWVLLGFDGTRALITHRWT